MIELICIVHTNARPTIVKLYLSVFEYEFQIPKYPAQAIVIIEKAYVQK